MQQRGVIDVAGGRGDLAFQLHCLRNITCVVVDPQRPNMAGSLSRYSRNFRQSKSPVKLIQSVTV